MADLPLHQHWNDIYIRRSLVVLTALSAAAVAFLFSSLATPVYEAKTTFYLAANTTPASFVGPTPDAPPAPLLPMPEEKAAALDVGILRGREVRARLAEEFGLSVAEMARRVDVTVSGEFMIDVFVRNPDPALAARIANAVPVVYSDFHERSMRERAGAVAAALTERLGELKIERRALQSQQRDSRSESLTTADDAALGRVQAERDAAQADREVFAGQISATKARQAALELTLKQEDGYYASGKSVNTTPTLDRMLESILDVQVDLAALSDGTKSPRRSAVEDQMRRLEEAVSVERHRLAEAEIKTTGSLYEDLRRELALNGARLAELDSALTAADARLTQATERFDSLLTAMAVSDDTRTALARVDSQVAMAEENLAAAQLQAAHATPPIVVVEAAVAPTRPTFPLPMLNALVAAVCGLVFGTYYALFLAHSERATAVRRAVATPVPLFTRDELAELSAPAAVFRHIPMRGDRNG